MTRALLLVLDSVGIGGAPDAARFGDEGADTLGHIAEAAAAGSASRAGLRSGPLRLPNFVALGLGEAARIATGRTPPGLEGAATGGLWGAAEEISSGKDTPSGHWELTGAPVLFDWGYFPKTDPAFPPELIADLVAQGGLPGVLGGVHASGTAIIERLGEEHVRTGKPIVYTSADSVFQIAAHEEAFGLERLYALCEIARHLVDPLNVGRVIARPFVGTGAADFARTGNRRDYATPPHEPTLLARASQAGREVVSVGKIGDIFAHEGTGRVVKAKGNAALLDAALAALADLPDGGFVIANIIDFDTEYGHRRDVAGYAAALEAFDARIPDIRAALSPGDLCVVTADHGCDPTWEGADHTRERVPVLAFGPGFGPGPIGLRASFADVGATLGAHLGLGPGRHGTPWTLGRT
ncbi:phosphopentomutase [Chenggangzhangella methanolivorans]|uniref:Phosphopentomutase n=1 Tax=Chenggangzhangella methanolivorans TaxID=1437009 RepID=A0A9E6RD68_9HYPH|nr:phosphopentomutase [Chenggangzhangella methanolivorans]QZO02200.1 phosphopentomutase [Chenggangzhangella methanolivorans]